MANAHRRNNSMDRIMINGELLTEDQEVRDGIVNEFQKLLSEEQGWRADIEGLQFNQLSSREADGLEVPFSVEEIHSALMEMGGDKAPGPDGFSVAFWQECWDFVKEEVVEMFKEFFEHGSFAKPISLLGGLYKLLAKVLANRLKKVLDRVVSVDPKCLVRGRQILDASLVANEVIDYWKKSKEKGLICKLDIEKAYDSINWKFLMKVLRKMGFGSRWRDWMWWCISTAKFSILINGVPAGFFSNSKGLRQGDPLSPYLFVLGMEVLSTLIRRACEGGFISGCRLRGRGGDELAVSHLLFATTLSSFAKLEESNLPILAGYWPWFEAASGLRINLAKSVLIPVGEVDELEELAAELGCRWGLYPLFTWGCPLEPTINLFFLGWGGRENEKKISPVEKAVYFEGGKNYSHQDPKEEGGLGIRKIDLLNKALLGKWVWRYAYEKDNLWKTVIGVKYGQEGGGWKTKEVGKGNRVLFWTDKWCGNEALAQSYPQLFTLAGQKNAKICEVWDSSMGQGGWNLRLARDLNDWEIEQIGDMLNLLKDFRLLLMRTLRGFPYRRIWMDKVPTKVSFFAWEASWGRSLLWISFREGGGSSQTGASYAAMKRKVRITSSYIVQ
ncbi:LINE-1 reverse transcriptase-like [Vitis vinifera]|uniref:LINE-1 reverse transcriptase-like n=1 Tax=Vitis vinifera TaxID=29760 RepID=A0A438H609_VITVI|nr:LINE-1 reverse transcriptase-like [Vitis vinifera]